MNWAREQLTADDTQLGAFSSSQRDRPNLSHIAFQNIASYSYEFAYNGMLS